MTVDEMLAKARENRGNSVIKCRVDLVQATGEYKKLSGKEDYKSSLLAIVDSYGTTGVKYSLVREVLYDTEMLNAAVTDLVDAKEITKGDGKRDFLMKTTKTVADRPKGERSPSNPTGEKATNGPDDVPPAAESPVQPNK